MRVIVIGAGIVGVCCALELRRRGLEVTVLDRLEPGEACSFGNAGILASASLTPVAMPGILRKVPRLLLDPDGPLAVRWRHIATLAPWLARFARASDPVRANEVADALLTVVGDSVERHEALARGSPAAALIRHAGTLHVYPDRAAFLADRSWPMRAARGVRFEQLAGNVLRAFEPSLSALFDHAVHVPGPAHVLDPSLYVKLLAEQLVREGGVVTQSEVRGVEAVPGTPARVFTDTGAVEADRLVVAAGVWSGRLAAQLGIRVPIEAERGYHVMVRNPGVEIERPVFHGTAAFVATPMADGLRFAGTDELAAIDAPPDYRRARIILGKARAMFPGIDVRDHTQWMGQRPSLPDSLPVVDRAPGRPAVHFAFGHQHIGLTGAPVTARWIADMVTDTRSNTDLGAFRIDRF